MPGRTDLSLTRRRTIGIGLSALIGLSLVGLTLGETSKASDWAASPVIPKLDAVAKRKLSATLRRGADRGAQVDVFAKVGDSISEGSAFLQGLGCGGWVLGRYSGLLATVRHFNRRRLSGTSDACAGSVNSFSRNSEATETGEPSGWAIQPRELASSECGPGETPLACEIRLVRPAFAVILFGTNDVSRGLTSGTSTAAQYIANMSAIIAIARSRGVEPILTTIPPRLDGAAEALTEQLNAGLVSLALQRHVPLINLWRALNPLPNRGISADRLHPSVYCEPVCQPTNFTSAGLRYGHNVHNLITLQTLRRLWGFAKSRRANSASIGSHGQRGK